MWPTLAGHQTTVTLLQRNEGAKQMTDQRRWSRRRVLGTTAAGAAAAVVSGGRLQEMLAARAAPATIQSGAKITYWGGLIFSPEANELLETTINDWGAANGVETEVVMINQNDLVQNVSAAVEAGTMPD